MKYEKEIDQILRDMIYEDWMSEDEYFEIVQLSLNKLGISFKVLNSQIEIGVLNGWDVKSQMEYWTTQNNLKKNIK